MGSTGRTRARASLARSVAVLTALAMILIAGVLAPQASSSTLGANGASSFSTGGGSQDDDDNHGGGGSSSDDDDNTQDNDDDDDGQDHNDDDDGHGGGNSGCDSSGNGGGNDDDDDNNNGGGSNDDDDNNGGGNDDDDDGYDEDDDEENMYDPDYYECLGYGWCWEVNNPSTPYTLGNAPSGYHWTLLVLFSGSPSQNNDWATEVPFPLPGQYVHPSGGSLDKIIKCKDSGPPPSTTTTSTTTTTQGGGCDDYIPTNVAVDPITLHALDPITITGSATPGDTVTATLTGGPFTNEFLGSDVTDGSGNFTINAVIPAGATPGSYTVDVTSENCPTSVPTTITVVSLTFSGCGENRSGRTFEQGEQVTWALHVGGFNTSQPVKLEIKKSSYSSVLYNGVWPTSDEVTVTIPATAPTGKHFMWQTGKKNNSNTKERKKKCPIWIVQPYNNVAFTAPAASQESSGPAIPPAPVAAGLLGLAMLIRLRHIARHNTRPRRVL